MNNYNIYSYKNDLYNNDKNNKFIYKTIFFDNLNNINEIIKNLKKEIKYFFNKMNISNNSHILIVGLGNDNYTADSIGPKTLKYIKVNSYLDNFNIKTKGIKVSALEPGVLSETGILTEKIIKSVTDEIKPDLVILIDSFVCNNVDFLNKTIELSNRGLNPGSGLIGIDSKIDYETLNRPVLVIGVPTAIEIKFNKKETNFVPYLLSSKDIDKYVDNISKIIADTLNEIIFDY